MTLLTDDQFNAELDKAVQIVKRFLADVPATSLPPGLSVIAWDATASAKQTLPIFLADFADEKKYTILEAVGQKLAKDQVDVLAVFLVTEVWLRRPQETPSGPVYGAITGEAVSVAGAAHDGRKNLCLLPIQRGRDRRILLEPAKAIVMEYQAGGASQVHSDLLDALWNGYRKGRARGRPGIGTPPSDN